MKLRFLATLAICCLASVAQSAPAPDSLVVTGPAMQQIPIGRMLVTPTGGTQATLGYLLSVGAGLPVVGGTMTGALNIINAGTGVNSNAIQITPPTIDTSIAGPLGGNYVNNYINIPLAPSVDTNHIFQPLRVFQTLDGPGRQLGELTNINTYMTVNVGGYLNTGENYEASWQNFGTTNTWNPFLVLGHNQSTGVATIFTGYNFTIQNDNTTPGALNIVLGYQCSAQTGPGALASFYGCFRNKDPNAFSDNLGPLQIGSLGSPPAGTMLRVFGADNSSATFPVVVKNAAGVNTFLVSDSGAVSAGSQFGMGITNPSGSTLANQISFNSTLTNNDASPGSVVNYIAYQCQDLQGAGSAPTSDNCLTNKDSNGLIASLGPLSLGGLGAAPAGTLLIIHGGDNSGASSALAVKNANGDNSFLVTDGGTSSFYGVLNLGVAGTSSGVLNFSNTTSGLIRLTPPTGALGTSILSLPVVPSATLSYGVQAPIGAGLSGFGTSPSVSAGTTTDAFQVTVGTGSPGTSGTVTFATPAAPAHGYACTVTDNTSPGTIAVRSVVTSTTVATWSAYSATTGAAANFPAGDVLVASCKQF